MSSQHHPDQRDPDADPGAPGERGGDGSEVDAEAGAGAPEAPTVADNAETVQDPDAEADEGEQGAAARRHAGRLERHTEREDAPIEPSSPTPPGSPREASG